MSLLWNIGFFFLFCEFEVYAKIFLTYIILYKHWTTFAIGAAVSEIFARFRDIEDNFFILFIIYIFVIVYCMKISVQTEWL